MRSAPRLAGILGALLAGACECPDPSWETEQFTLEFDDSSEWVSAEGSYIRPCEDACAEVNFGWASSCEYLGLEMTTEVQPAPGGAGHSSGGLGGATGLGGAAGFAGSEAGDAGSGQVARGYELRFSCTWLNEDCPGGRRHAGWRSEPTGRGRTDLGRWLGRAAGFEAGSVESFRHLARELKALSAPSQLIRRCLRAADDELRHAATMNQLAQRHGGEPVVPDVRTLAPRSPRKLALENAREGCVMESYAALLAHHQAQHAPDPALRRAMSTIARDETRHAQLAWDLHAWLLTQLTAEERTLVEAELRAALVALQKLPQEKARIRSALGLPSLAQAARYRASFATELRPFAASA